MPVAVIALLVFTLFPVYWMISTALDPKAISRGSDVLPSGISFEHFTFVFEKGNFGTYLLNSALVGLATIVAAALLSLFAAIAVARFKFRFRTSVLIMILIVQMVPLEALVIPLFIQMRDYELLNSLLGLSIVYIALSLPFAIWTLRGFVATIPKEVEEAAYIDGASWFRMFRSVLLPLVGPGLVATSIFAFITAWNEFVFAYTFMKGSDKYTAAVGIYQFFGENSTSWGPVMASSTLVTVPVMIFFVIVHRKLGSGLAAGAVKG
ncbi:carbohydrate ABC transporter permease [Streptomyces alfalfae]|uniref:Carbohydrate ABC transporter permease n=1 Tax=Streptomyces alfalfae TaxID=1642299 RepID=A0A1P8TU68_9ACTN|nr:MULTISPECIES: carbohydrate ABC transporter permease [Streptomyces]AYA21392.1 carbohydrate ABC transporter permease [Streptomyces fradiae]APY91149.1 sugar ABC transporter permease [Streptomyces alfalfae]KUL50002.1 sugar ABC transporter permease [Streptomyces sp. NRRL S-1521]QQC93705.1 carbohydrate ABC transporter permease [Streptomyces alfalfae]QUI35787.1 carbohydrate ABC transporter permease [Streptomyces alfalfae]